METTTDQQKVVLTWKVAIPIMISLLLISNTFTRLVSTIEQNTNQIVYDNDASKRRIENAVELQDLKLELKLCKENK